MRTEAGPVAAASGQIEADSDDELSDDEQHVVTQYDDIHTPYEIRAGIKERQRKMQIILAEISAEEKALEQIEETEIWRLDLRSVKPRRRLLVVQVRRLGRAVCRGAVARALP